MFVLAIALCHFANSHSTELDCETIQITTDDCAATLYQLKDEYRHTEKFVKMALCIKNIKYTKIQTEKPYQQLGTWKIPT